MNTGCDYEFLIKQWGYTENDFPQDIILSAEQEIEVLDFLGKFIVCAEKHKPYKVPFAKALIETCECDYRIGEIHPTFQKLFLKNIKFFWV
jgi:hypothetical protein